jgi:hypothetical protein
MSDGHPYQQIHIENTMPATVSISLLGIAKISTYLVKVSMIVRAYLFL